MTMKGQRWQEKDDQKLKQEKQQFFHKWNKVAKLKFILHQYLKSSIKDPEIPLPLWQDLELRIQQMSEKFLRTTGAIRARWLTLETKNKPTKRKTGMESIDHFTRVEKKMKTDTERKTSASQLWDEKQQAVIDLVVNKHGNLFLTGGAGSGKSFLVHHLITSLRSQNRRVAVTGPTGLAACNIQGCTLHRFAGWQAGAEYANDVDALVAAARKRCVFANRWRKLDILIIDEVSMVSAIFFEKMDQMVRILRNQPDRPWGGIQILVLGDFFQLPPIVPNGTSKQFCFEASNWLECFPASSQIELTHIYRQADDVTFAHHLSAIRRGECSPETLSLLQSRVLEWKVPELSEGPIITPTSLYTHRQDVKKQNELELASLKTPAHVYRAIDSGKALYRDKLDKESHATTELTLKVGAQVILIKNLNEKQDDIKLQLANGSRGVVIDFVADRRTLGYTLMPRVQFFNGQIRTLTPEPFPVLIGDEEVACRHQIPLDLAWGLTIHRAQGMTIDLAIMDLSRCFEAGQFYVALSRLRSLQGLYLKPFHVRNIRAHPKVLEWEKEKVAKES